MITPEAKHALISEKIEGWSWIRYSGTPESTCDGRIRAFLASPQDRLEWLQAPKYIDDDGVYPRELRSSVPEYSTSLEACARAEAKLGRHWPAYVEALEAQVLISRDDNTHTAAWLRITAPASARAEALYRLAQSLSEER